MKKLKYWTTLLTISCISLAHAADTVTVAIAGVVLENGKERAGGETVAVYTSKDRDPRGKIGEGKTSPRGVYNVVMKNVGRGVSSVSLVVERKGAIADPQPLNLGADNDGIRQATAEDILLEPVPTTAQRITPEQAGKLLASTIKINAIKIDAGVLPDVEAEKAMFAMVDRLKIPVGLPDGPHSLEQKQIAAAFIKETKGSIDKGWGRETEAREAARGMVEKAAKEGIEARTAPNIGPPELRRYTRPFYTRPF